MKARRAIAAALLAGALGACSGTPTPEPADPARTQAEQVARFAFDRQRYDQAARLYARALDRAYRRDDLSGIRDLGTAEALALLRAGRPAEALAAARRIAAELGRRDELVPPVLTLIRAEAHYVSGALGNAQRMAQRVHDAGASTPLRARATYLQGLVAADRGEGAALRDAYAAMPELSGPALHADRAMLAGRIAAGDGDRPRAYRAYLLAAGLRRGIQDDPGMAQALADAAGVAPNNTAAADLYLRAGRTADLLGRSRWAQRWLCAAIYIADAGGSVETQALARLGDRACE